MLADIINSDGKYVTMLNNVKTLFKTIHVNSFAAQPPVESILEDVLNTESDLHNREELMRFEATAEQVNNFSFPGVNIREKLS